MSKILLEIMAEISTAFQESNHSNEDLFYEEDYAEDSETESSDSSLDSVQDLKEFGIHRALPLVSLDMDDEVEEDDNTAAALEYLRGVRFAIRQKCRPFVCGHHGAIFKLPK